MTARKLNPTPRGGSRRGAGRPQNRLRLDPDTAQTLRVLTLARAGVLGRTVAPEEVVADLIRLAWRAYDAGIERDAATELSTAAATAAIDDWTGSLSEEQQHALWIGLPMGVDEDSLTVEHFLIDVWRQPVTPENLLAFGAAFRAWVANGYRPA